MLNVSDKLTHKPARRLVEIDALRGLAAMQVVLFHLTAAYDLPYAPLIRVTAPQVGVAMFFIISGFVISLSLERSASPLSFLKSRFSRLFPPFWFCCALIAVFVFTTGYNPFNLAPADLPANVSMLNGLLGHAYIDPDYWTLTRELLFYALLGGIFYVFPRKYQVLLVAIWLVVSSVYNIEIADDNYYACVGFRSCGAILLNSHFCYLFVIGVTSYHIHSGDRRPIVLLTFGIAILAAGLSEWPTYHHFVPVTAAKAALYAGILYAATAGHLRFLAIRPLLFLGAVSYPLYLVHHVFGFAVLHVLLAAGVGVNVALMLTLTILITLATAVCFGIERPTHAALNRVWLARRLRITYPQKT